MVDVVPILIAEVVNQETMIPKSENKNSVNHLIDFRESKRFMLFMILSLLIPTIIILIIYGYKSKIFIVLIVLSLIIYLFYIIQCFEYILIYYYIYNYDNFDGIINFLKSKKEVPLMCKIFYFGNRHNDLLSSTEEIHYDNIKYHSISQFNLNKNIPNIILIDYKYIYGNIDTKNHLISLENLSINRCANRHKNVQYTFHSCETYINSYTSEIMIFYPDGKTCFSRYSIPLFLLLGIQYLYDEWFYNNHNIIKITITKEIFCNHSL